MLSSLHELFDGKMPQVWRGETQLRQEFSRVATAALRGERMDGASRLEALLADDQPAHDGRQAARTRIAASAALLPITPEMAWAVPQLLKRVQLVSPGILSTSGVLRSLIRNPAWDEPFAKAFADSGFLSCDQVIERARWKYDIQELLARQRAGADPQVLDHCRAVLAQHRTRQPLDWAGVLGDLLTLSAWFPELRTVQQLAQLYARLYVLHMESVLVVQCWLDWRAGLAD